ncbi:DEXDc domain containing protein [uncultured Caudovirales phage]|uniref:DEXDc domain containing protein n=1 Tax=uncultured Caudovirales phage TaxID=2100421 RepID=A0A6J5KXU3_9CAUD|nr:DEXDc domain containing protein [uncultured Caudovirales phage]
MLTDYQEAAIPRLAAGNTFLWWDAGSGKTLPMLAAGAQLGGRLLYLCPPVVRQQVAREAVHFDCYDKGDIQVILHGKDKVAPQAKLVVCSYEHAIMPPIWKQLFALEWEALALDEAHQLKDTRAKRTQAVYGARIDSRGALFRKAKRVWCATGTPILADPSDLWSHVSRLYPQLLLDLEIKNRDEWIDHFCYTQQTPYGPKVLGGRRLDELKAVLDPIVSRVKKSGLPPLTLTHIWVPPQALDLSDVPEEALEELRKLLDKGAAEKLSGLEVPLATLRKRIGLAKAAHCVELLLSEAQAGVGKTIVFYQHKAVAAEMMALLDKSQLKGKYTHYSGGLTPGKRDAVVAEFFSAPCRLLLAQVQASGVGLNLQCAERVIVLEPAWTPAVNEQAIARAWRKGQQKNVWASFVMLSGSVDEAVSSCVLRKSAIIERVLS